MTFEVEQKFPVEELSAVEARLCELGAAVGAPRQQVDRYCAHPNRDFAQTDEALRIRRVGEANFVTYKGPKIDAATKTRREIEIALPAGAEGDAQFAALLEALGFRPVAEVRKQRRTARLVWQEQAVEAALDEVQGLGSYVELELGADEQGLDAARAALTALTARLGLEHPERRSYLELLLAQP